MKVFEFERPLVRLSGRATGMSLRFSQNSLQFGRVRKRGCKILKVMLFNEGDFGAKYVKFSFGNDHVTGYSGIGLSSTIKSKYRKTMMLGNPFLIFSSCYYFG